MRHTRLFTTRPLIAGQSVTLEAAPSRHLTQVLRLGAGAALWLFNGDGRDFAARVVIPARGAVEVQVESAGELEAPPPLSITLAIGVSRAERMDFALQKAVELGVARLIPLFTERGVVRLSDQRLEKRMQHWRGIVIAACEQSGRRRLPGLAPAQWLGDWLDDAPAGGLLLDPRGSRSLAQLTPPGGGELLLLVGPEGGLSPVERQATASRDFVAVRLGPRVMRTETAPLAAIAAIQTLWGDFRD